MEKIATSFCSYETLRKRYTYVDKTDLLWRLVSDSDDRMFFISRPRRFRQIRDKGYADACKGVKRPVTLVGINFRNQKRSIDESIFEVF